MTRHSSVMNPYAGNVLDAGLRPIVAREEAIKILRVIPDFPSELKAAPPHIRLHHLMRVRELHVPAQSELALWRGLDLMVRDCYRRRDPRLNTTWADISGEVPYMRQPDKSLNTDTDLLQELVLRPHLAYKPRVQTR